MLSKVTVVVCAVHCAVSVTLPPAVPDRFLKYTAPAAPFLQLVVLLIAVVGLIYITGLEKAEPQPQATVAATTATPEATATPDPTDEPDDADKEAQAQDAAAQDTMYEGALAGLTDEEIEQQALAEEAMEGAGGATND